MDKRQGGKSGGLEEEEGGHDSGGQEEDDGEGCRSCLRKTVYLREDRTEDLGNVQPFFLPEDFVLWSHMFMNSRVCVASEAFISAYS